MILDEIVQRKREDVRLAKQERPIAMLQSAPGYAAARRSLAATLQRSGRRVIAELKRSSPSRGRLCSVFDPGAIARSYQAAGAAAVSVLTEEHWFEGDIRHLELVRRSIEVPVLRKDFILDTYQVQEARAFGADAILLIVRILSEESLRLLLEEARAASLEVLAEVHDREDLDRALRYDIPLIGVNNRNLATMEVNLDTTLALCRLVPSDRTVVAESGIRSGSDIERLEAAGVHAFLIGEALMEAADPGLRLREFLSWEKRAERENG